MVRGLLPQLPVYDDIHTKTQPLTSIWAKWRRASRAGAGANTGEQELSEREGITADKVFLGHPNRVQIKGDMSAGISCGNIKSDVLSFRSYVNNLGSRLSRRMKTKADIMALETVLSATTQADDNLGTLLSNIDAFYRLCLLPSMHKFRHDCQRQSVVGESTNGGLRNRATVIAR